MLTVPGAGGRKAPALSALVPRSRRKPAGPPADRDTSAWCCSRSRARRHRALNAAFESRRAEKTYLALVRFDLAKGATHRCSAGGGARRACPRGRKGRQAAQTQVAPKDDSAPTRSGVPAAHGRRAPDPRPPGRRRAPARRRSPLRRGAAICVGDLWSGRPIRTPSSSTVRRCTQLRCGSRIRPGAVGSGWSRPCRTTWRVAWILLRAARRSGDVGPLR